MNKEELLTLLSALPNNAEYERTHGSLHGCLEFRQLAEWLKDYKRLLEQQPTTTTNNNEPITVIYPTIVCDDAISREAALEKMADYVASGYADSAEDFEKYSRIICQLPPVTPQPKYGKWIDGKCNKCGTHAPFWSMATTYYCSEYCPKCGAKMQESEDKK